MERTFLRASIASLVLLLAMSLDSRVMGQTINIGSSADLFNAIETIDSNPNNSYTLNFNGNLTLGQALPFFASNSNITLSGNSNTINGASLYQPLIMDSGTVTLQNINIINPGQPTTINGGTLIDTTGSLQGPVTNNGKLTFNETASTTFGGIISGSGNVEISGANTVTFTGANTYTGGTKIDTGSTLFETGGSLQGAVTNNGSVLFYETTTDTYSGNMSGTGGVEINGGGAVTFSGTNTYTGGTTIDNSTTLIGTTTSLQGPITNNYLLDFNQATNGTYGGNISGLGGVELTGTGVVTFTGTNTYESGTYVSKDSTLIGTTSSLQGAFYNYGAVQFNQSTSGTYAGSMQGIGTVEISGAGPITFTGMNTYTGGTTVDVGSTLIGTTNGIQGGIANNGAVQFNQTASGTYAGSMSGTGGVEISGAGPITFSGTNTYTGGTLVDSGSTLIGPTSGVQGNIVNNGVVEFNQTTNGTYAGNMLGTGSVEISGPGVVTFYGTNTYTGGTTIENGGLLSGTTSNLQGAITDNGSMQFNQSTSANFNGHISGTGSVEISNTGAVTFTTANTYTGGTFVDVGANLVGNTSNLQGTFINDGNVKFVDLPISPSQANTFSVQSTSQLNLPGYGPITIGPIGPYTSIVSSTYSGNMSGTGRVEISGGGMTAFTGTNSYTGGTTVDKGSTLTGSTNGLQGNITNNGFVQFNNGLGPNFISPVFVQGNPVAVLDIMTGYVPNSGLGFAGTYSGNMSGTGGVEISGTGPIAFTGTNSYTGGTSVDGGSVLVGNTNSIQGLFVNNGVVNFSQTTGGTYDGNMSGVGSVLINGPAPVTFSGTNTYSGGTTVASGSALIGTTSSLQGTFFDSGLVQFNQTTTGTYQGGISGAGGVEISGLGTVTFTGANNYTGGTKIDNGSTLIVSSSGSIEGNVVVGNGGTLMGGGSVSSTTVNAGGTIYPGTVGAPLTVKGNFTQGTGSTYTAELNPTGGDKIIATGSATVNSGTTLNLVVDQGTYTVGSKYEILSATNGLNGTYSTTSTSLYNQDVVFTQQYNANNLQLVVNSNLSNFAQTPNQAGVASVLDQASGSATGNFANAITQLTTLNQSQLSAALNQASGGIYPNLGTLQVQTSTVELQLLSNRLASLSGPGVAAIGVAQRRSNMRFVSSQSSDLQEPDASTGGGSMDWTGWVQGYGLGGNISGDGNSGGVNFRLGGTLLGVERWLDESVMLGVLGGYTSTSVGDHQDGSSAQISAYQAGLYELYRGDSFYVSNIDAFVNNDDSVSRPLSFGTFQQTATGNGHGNQWAHYTESGRTFEFDDIKLQPFMGLQYLYLDQHGYSESGAGSMDLTTSGQIVNSIRNGVGARIYAEKTWRDVLIIPSFSARYQHEWANGTQLISSSLAGAPTAQFATTGTHTGRDFGLFSLNATAFVTDRFSVYGMIDSQVAAGYYAVIGSGGIRYSW